MGQFNCKQMICQPPSFFRKQIIQKIQKTAERIPFADFRTAAVPHGTKLGIPEKIVKGHLVELSDFNSIIQTGLMYPPFIVGYGARGAAKKSGQLLLPDVPFFPKQCHLF